MENTLHAIIALTSFPVSIWILLKIAERPPRMNLNGLYTITWYQQNQRKTRTYYLTTDRHRIYHRSHHNQRWRLLCYSDQIITCYKHGN